MRVTKTIKEYIEKRVKAIMPTTSEAEEKWNKERQLVADFRESATKKLERYASELIAEFYEENGFTPSNTWALFPNDWIKVSEKGYLPSKYEADTAKNKRTKEINEAIENIIVALELGGTKAELEEMLNNLRGE
jgi:hypothetical protein